MGSNLTDVVQLVQRGWFLDTALRSPTPECRRWLVQSLHRALPRKKEKATFSREKRRLLARLRQDAAFCETFVEQWLAAVAGHSNRLGEDDSVRELVRKREMSLKKSRSRFTNRRALDQWGGSSGLGRMTYRWPTSSTFLEDLYDGLHREGDA